MHERPTFGSLFAGIGGIDLGLERAGWRGRWQVEYEPFCQRVLAKHWPDVRRHGDIRDVDWSGVEPVDLVAGGFPCQPFSVAGKQRGMDDDRWLWPEFERCLRALRPRYVLVENVPGLLVGRGMDAVLGGLADLGYDTEWECIPAAAVGAPHLRYRVWIVGYRRELGPLERVSDPGHGELRVQRERQQASEWRDGRATESRHDGANGSLADTDQSGSQRPDQRAAGTGGMGNAERGGWAGRPSDQGWGSERRDAAGGPGTAGGWSDHWLVEPDVGRVAHGVPARVDRLRSLGNAVVPQVVEFIGRRILEAEAVTA